MTDDRPIHIIEGPEDLRRLLTGVLRFPLDIEVPRAFDDLEATLYVLFPLCSRGIVNVTRRELDNHYVWYQLADRDGDLGDIGGISVVQTRPGRTTVTMHPPQFRIREVIPEDWANEARDAERVTAPEAIPHPHSIDPGLLGRVRHSLSHAAEWLRETSADTAPTTRHQNYEAALRQAEEAHRRQFQMFEHVIHDFLSKLASEPVLSPGYRPVGQRAKEFYLESRKLVFECGYAPDEAFRQIFPQMFAEVAGDLIAEEQIDPTSTQGFARIVQVARSRFDLGVGC